MFIANDLQALQEHQVESKRKVFINLGTMELHCFDCNSEILDENLISVPPKNRSLVNLKKDIKSALRIAILKTFSTCFTHRSEMQVFPPASLQEFGLNFLQSNNMTNSFPISIYLLWSIPYLRTLFKRLYLIEVQSLKNNGNILTST